MKNVRDLLDLRHRKSFRLGLLLLSTLFIISAGALVYAGMVYEKALQVGNTGGVTPGSGSTGSAEVSFTPAAIMMLAVAGLVVGLSMFGFLREASKHISNAPLHLPFMQGEEWEESPTREEGEESPTKEEGEESLHLPFMEGEEWEESPTKVEGEE